MGNEWLRQFIDFSKQKQRAIVYLLENGIQRESEAKSKKEISEGLGIDIRNMTSDLGMLELLGFLKSVKKTNSKTGRKTTYYYLNPESLMPVSDPGYIVIAASKISDSNLGERYLEPTINYDTYKKVDPDYALNHRNSEGKLVDF